MKSNFIFFLLLCAIAMFHHSQTRGCGFLTLHSRKLTNSQINVPKTFILAGASHFLFKPPPPLPLLSFRSNCDATNGTFLVFDRESEIYSTYYLIDTLGLSAESAERLTKEVRLKSVENADAVVALFREYGFTSDHMVDIFSAFPKLLNSKPAQTLKPKLDCFIDNGISGDLLHRVLASDPHILRISLHRRIAPCFDLLNAFYDGDQTAVASLLSLRRGTWVLRNFGAATAPNVETLLRHGVSKSCIAKLFIDVPSLSRPTEELEDTVREVKEMGFDPSNTSFVRAVRAFSVVNKERREAKLELFKSFGWTDQQIRSIMMRRPDYHSLSVEKLRESLEFFMTKHQWSAEDITRHFQLLTFSLENRISPRYTVLEILASRGLVEKIGFVTAFQVTEATFLEKFVKRYEQDLPNLQQLYYETMPY